MNSVLMYPYYLPRKQSLRSHLLFYDTISTIVPHVDQAEVREREHIRQLSKKGDESLLSFFDPEHGYTRWVEQEQSINHLKKLVKTHKKKRSTKSARRKIETDDYGFVKHPKAQAPLINFLKDEKNWKTIAFQKIPYDIEQRLLSADLMFRMPRDKGREQHPVLLPGEIANYLIARLAREISSDPTIAPIADKTVSLRGLLHDDEVSEMSLREQRAQAIALSIDLSMPPEIETIRSGDYLAIRASYQPVRDELRRIADSLMTRFDLDSERNIVRFREDARDKLRNLSSLADAAYDNWKWEKRKSFAIDLFAGGVGATLGAMAGQLPLAFLGGCITPVLARGMNRYSTRANIYDNTDLREIGAMRSKIIAQKRREDYEATRPFYHL